MLQGQLSQHGRLNHPVTVLQPLRLLKSMNPRPLVQECGGVWPAKLRGACRGIHAVMVVVLRRHGPSPGGRGAPCSSQGPASRTMLDVVVVHGVVPDQVLVNREPFVGVVPSVVVRMVEQRRLVATVVPFHTIMVISAVCVRFRRLLYMYTQCKRSISFDTHHQAAFKGA